MLRYLQVNNYSNTAAPVDQLVLLHIPDQFTNSALYMSL
jgi:hypothetical protein